MRNPAKLIAKLIPVLALGAGLAGAQPAEARPAADPGVVPVNGYYYGPPGGYAQPGWRHGPPPRFYGPPGHYRPRPPAYWGPPPVVYAPPPRAYYPPRHYAPQPGVGFYYRF